MLKGHDQDAEIDQRRLIIALHTAIHQDADTIRASWANSPRAPTDGPVDGDIRYL